MPRVVALRVDAVAAGVEDFYQSFQLKPERAAEIREGVLAELETERDQAAHDHARATHRLARLRPPELGSRSQLRLSQAVLIS